MRVYKRSVMGRKREDENGSRREWDGEEKR